MEKQFAKLTPVPTALAACMAIGFLATPGFGGEGLDSRLIPKYVQPLVVPPAMPKTPHAPVPGIGAIDYYEIGVRQFAQQVLPPGFPPTTVWGYGSANHPGTFNYPGFTIEARWNRTTRIMWINELVDARGNFLPHLLPVDPTLHWANPQGGIEGRDSTPTFESTPGPYTGPVPIVTHVHGASTGAESDGYTEAWYLPAASDIPADYATVGSHHDTFKIQAEAMWGAPWSPGSAVFHYPNTQPAGTLWYHDHTLGLTRLNVYAGMAGFYLLRGGPNDVNGNRLPSGAFEVPLAIQDRSFSTDGSLRYPESREQFDGFAGPYIPESDISPIWNPEFFGDAIVVNGRTWPSFTAEARRYRFRLLNGCDSRFLILKVVGDPMAPRPASATIPWHQIGTDLGFLQLPVVRDEIVLGPGERADVLLDLTGVAPGTSLFVINEGPDEPFGGGVVGLDFEPAAPWTTGQVMRIDVVAPTSLDVTAPVGHVKLHPAAPPPPATVVRKLALMEMDSDVLPDVGPRMAMLGMVNPDETVTAMMWHDPISEVIQQGATEIWEIHNMTMDAHPIHLHEVGFAVMDRINMMTGEITPAPPWERGRKDTEPPQFPWTRLRDGLAPVRRSVFHDRHEAIPV